VRVTEAPVEDEDDAWKAVCEQLMLACNGGRTAGSQRNECDDEKCSDRDGEHHHAALASAAAASPFRGTGATPPRT
jgi:hypothetical protein